MMENTRERILYLLKRDGPMTADGLARSLNITSMGVRQHLSLLEKDGLVDHHSEKHKMGRPGYSFSLTAAGDDFFPRTYAQMANNILETVRQMEGEKGIEKIFRGRLEVLEKQYRARMKQPDLAGRIAELAAIRTEEGYMADWKKEGANKFLLRELNCAICQVAKQCIQACDYELKLFQKVLPETEITREEHIVKGDRMCTYIIRKKK
jgi:iron-sulfur cluster biosynthesis transcriptional regulator SufR